jgi:hypothetical protein
MSRGVITGEFEAADATDAALASAAARRVQLSPEGTS